MEEISIKGTRVWRQGEGVPLILLHGVGLDITMWDRTADALARHFDVIRFDFWGHGESDDPPGPRSLEDLRDQVLMVADALQIERFHLIGFSLGALTARALIAHAWQRLERVVLMNGIAAREASQLSGVRERLAKAEEEGPASIIAAAIVRWFTAEFLADDPPIVDQVRHRLESNRPEGFLKCYRIYGLSDGNVPVPPEARHLPVLALTADEDLNSTPAMSKDLAAAFDQGEAKSLPKLRHLAILEDPELVNGTLLEFLLRK